MMSKKRILILFLMIILMILGRNVKFQSIFKNIKILGISNDFTNVLGVLKANEMEYVVCSIGDDLKIYDKDKKIMGTYNIGKGKKKMISFCIEDLNNDGNDEILLIIGEKSETFGNKMIILSFDGSFKELYNKSFSNLNPWKVQTADVDGDGRKEISIGVYKKTKFYPVMEKRPFIYEWKEGSIFPKWRGSRLSKPFDDYIFLDIDEDQMDEIIAIEVLEDGRKCINAYKWKGFGFEGVGESKGYEQIYKILKEDGNNKIYAKVNDKEDIIWVILSYIDGKWIVQKRVADYVPSIDINKEWREKDV